MQIIVGIVMFLLITAALSCFLMAIAVAARSSPESTSAKNLPGLLPIAPLNKREAKIMEDLDGVSQKIGLRLLAKAPLSAVVEAEREGARRKWKERLSAWQVDFLLLDPDTLKPALAVLPVEPNGGQEHRRQVCTAALSAAQIPYILLGSYNLPGLEKAVKAKLADVPAVKR